MRDPTQQATLVSVEEVQTGVDARLAAGLAPVVTPLFTRSVPRALTWDFQGIQPPATLYMAEEDILRVSYWMAFSDFTLSATCRHLGTDGRVVLTRATVRTVGTLLRQSFDVNLPEGFLLSLEVELIGASFQRGQCYVNVDIGTTVGGDRVTYGHLIQSEVSALYHPTWPYSPHRYPALDVGAWDLIVLPQVSPPVTQIAQLTLGTWVKVQAVVFSVTTSAVVGNRTYRLTLTQPGGSVIHDMFFIGLQPASTTWTYNAFVGGVNINLAGLNRQELPLPNYRMQNGATVTLTPVGADPGDTIGEVQINYEYGIGHAA